jgi:hypothetical protein
MEATANSSTASANQVKMTASSQGGAAGDQQTQTHQNNNSKAQVPTFNGIPLPDNSIRAPSKAQEIDGLGDLPHLQKQETKGPGGREMFSIHGEQVRASTW